MATNDSWKDNSILKKIYVGNLKEETDEEKLKEYFGQYGEIQETKLIRFPDGKSRKCAFITFSDCDCVDNILFNYDAHNIDGKTVDVRRAIPREDPDPLAHIRTKKLFVGGLKNDQTEEDIKTALAAFIPFEPTSIRLMRERETNKFKGFAFVNFENENIVDKLFLIRKVLIKNQPAEMKKAAELGGGGGGGRGSRGAPRGGQRGGSQGFGGQRGGRGGRGGGGGGGGGYGSGGYGGDYAGYQGGYEGYGGYGGYDNYNRGYGGGGQGGDYYNGYGGGYGGYGNSYGGGGNMGQYTQEQSGYGPSRGRGGRGGRGGGGSGYRPY